MQKPRRNCLLRASAIGRFLSATVESHDLHVVAKGACASKSSCETAATPGPDQLMSACFVIQVLAYVRKCFKMCSTHVGYLSVSKINGLHNG